MKIISGYDMKTISEYGRMVLSNVTSSVVATMVEEASKSKKTAATTTSSSSVSTWDFTYKLVFLHTPLSWHLEVKEWCSKIKESWCVPTWIVAFV